MDGLRGGTVSRPDGADHNVVPNGNRVSTARGARGQAVSGLGPAGHTKQGRTL